MQMSMNNFRTQKVAVIHDWLTAPGGAERVLEQILIAYPEADLYTVCDFMHEKHRSLLVGRTPITSFIQKLPYAKQKYQVYLPLMPVAIEQFDLSAYDLIISSSYAVAKGVITGPEQTHVCYIHAPIRYAWHLQHQYLKESNLTRGFRHLIARVLLHHMRIWDLRSAAGVNVFVANSRYVAKQVTQLYKEKCLVLNPPVDVDRFTIVTEKEDYYVSASRLVAYKRVDLIVRAFGKMPHRKLIVIGDGPESARVKAAAKGHNNIQILGYQSDDSFRSLVSKAKAFMFAAIEDFGIAPTEAQACGTPVIALGKGGALETVRPIGVEEPTGIFFNEQTEEAIIQAVERFEREGAIISATECRKNALRFNAEDFRKQFVHIVDAACLKQQESDYAFEEYTKA